MIVNCLNNLICIFIDVCEWCHLLRHFTGALKYLDNYAYIIVSFHEEAPKFMGFLHIEKLPLTLTCLSVHRSVCSSLHVSCRVLPVLCGRFYSKTSKLIFLYLVPIN